MELLEFPNDEDSGPPLSGSQLADGGPPLSSSQGGGGPLLRGSQGGGGSQMGNISGLESSFGK